MLYRSAWGSILVTALSQIHSFAGFNPQKSVGGSVRNAAHVHFSSLGIVAFIKASGIIIRGALFSIFLCLTLVHEI